MDDRAFDSLKNYLSEIPAIFGEVGFGSNDSGEWWVKFSIDIQHQYAWHTVQELGHVLNYLSLNERLPTRFMPVSSPPYMNGGPDDFLSWVIECDDPEFRPGTCMKWLEGRLPRPVSELKQWQND